MTSISSNSPRLQSVSTVGGLQSVAYSRWLQSVAYQQSVPTVSGNSRCHQSAALRVSAVGESRSRMPRTPSSFRMSVRVPARRTYAGRVRVQARVRLDRGGRDRAAGCRSVRRACGQVLATDRWPRRCGWPHSSMACWLPRRGLPGSAVRPLTLPQMRMSDVTREKTKSVELMILGFELSKTD